MLVNSFAWQCGPTHCRWLRAAVGACLLLSMGCSGKLELIDERQNVVYSGGDGAAGHTATGEDASRIEAAPETSHAEAEVDSEAAAPETSHIETSIYPDGGGDSTESGSDAPQSCEAHADVQVIGACTAIYSWVVWDGAHCVRVGGSGCGCGGADCAYIYDDDESSCVAAHTECYHATCEAQIAYQDSCAYSVPEQFYGAFWNGASCFDLAASFCLGEDCQNSFKSVAECEAVHSACPASICTATKGTWHASAPCGPCGDYMCGIAPSDNCCDAGCDCGPGRRFDKVKGCIPEPSCTPEQTCAATGGTWACCPVACGVETLPDCSACTGACNCGPHRQFDPALGCVADPSCNATTGVVCAATGGTWKDGVCGHFLCGFRTGDDCTSPGCDCGYGANFDPALGCVYDPACYLLDYNQQCAGDEWCRPGLVCCQNLSPTGRCTEAANCSIEACGA